LDLWIAIACLLAACVPQSSESRRTTVVYASGADLQSINPLVTVHTLAKAVQKHVLFLTLASYDSALNPVPRLAQWTWGPDRRTLTFNMRPDVSWNDGVPTRARDVAWTIETAMQPRVAFPRARDLSGVIAVEVIDSLTVRIRFRRTQAMFPDVLTDLAILPAHRFEGVDPSEIRTAAFNRSPVGNGPFEFVEYRPNQHWVFRRSDTFPDDLERPEIERLVVVVVDEPATKLAALTSGELDFAGVSPAHASFVEENPQLEIIDYPIPIVYALIWNLRRPPFDDTRVRRALTLALDRQLVIEAYLYGFGIVAHGPVPPEHPWYVPVPPIPFDTAAATRMLEDAGWHVGGDGIRRKGNLRLEFDLLTVGSGDAPLEQMIQAQLREVGADVRIRMLELSSFLARVQANTRDFDAIVTGIPGDLSLGYVAAMFSGSDPGPLAYSGYGNEELDEALQRAAEAETEPELKAAWGEVQQLLSRDVPTTWLYHARGLQGANRRILNTRIDLRGELAGISGWEIESRP